MTKSEMTIVTSEMALSSPPDDLKIIATRTATDPLTDWQSLLVSAIEKLRRLAETSEDKFLLIGEQMQAVAQNSFEISQVANQLVETASEENLQALSLRLRKMATDMGKFLASFQSRSTQSFSTLNEASGFLGQLDAPLEGVKKITKAFYMLEVSVKIEGVLLGRMGDGLVTLALDIKNLSQQVTDKLSNINAHRGSLFTMISKNLCAIKQLGTVEEEDARRALQNTLANLHELDSANERFTQLGVTIADTVIGISNSIGEVVSSLQFHDINRQQLEHVILALDRLNSDIGAAQRGSLDEAARQTLISAVGDACEIQEGQLHFAQSELNTAVSLIIENLRQVATLQSTIQRETMAASGVMNETGASFVDGISRGMSITSELLNACASSHQEMARTMEEMAVAICASASMVNEIDGIGDSIVQTAMNALITAGKAGHRGATLAALAEEIRKLSDNASRNTDAIAVSLNEIGTLTTNLINETSQDETILTAWLTTVDKDVHEIMTMLGDMKGQLHSLVTLVEDKISALANDVERITASIDVHEQSKSIADEVLAVLRQVIDHCRDLVPASSEFKEGLQQMAGHYTIGSEHLVHQAIASRHGCDLGLAEHSQMPSSAAGESGFGDNVDLF